jgi:hypothetical protein
MISDTINSQEKQIGRRGFIARLGKAAGAIYLLSVASVTMFATGCTVWDDIKSWIPIALEAIGSVVALIPGLSFLSPIVTVITAGLDQILSDVNQYQNSAGATLVSKIQAGLSDVVANFQAFLQSINVTDPTLVTIVTGLSQIFLSTIAAFQQELTAAGAPPPAAPATRTAMRIGRAGQQIQVVAHKRSKRQFISDWNSALTSAHKDLQIH